MSYQLEGVEHLRQLDELESVPQPLDAEELSRFVTDTGEVGYKPIAGVIDVDPRGASLKSLLRMLEIDTMAFRQSGRLLGPYVMRNADTGLPEQYTGIMVYERTEDD